MSSIEKKFSLLDYEFAPGQESHQKIEKIQLKGEKIEGIPIDFTHGDVETFKPITSALDNFIEGVSSGNIQAYTEYRGREEIRESTAEKISNYLNVGINPDKNIIITPGTQGALFLAVGANVMRGDKVAIVEPDYFANRKLVNFFEGEIFSIKMEYLKNTSHAGLDLNELEEAFRSGVKLFLFSNPNNPVGVVYSQYEIKQIAELASRYGVTVIVDQLYSRQTFEGTTYTHFCKQDNINHDN